MGSLWPWIVAGGLPTLGLLLLGLFNPAAAVRLLSAISGLLLDAATGLLRWVRKPRTGEQWWRFACLSLGAGFALASFALWDARQTIVIVREKCAADVGAAQTEATQAKASATTATNEAKSCRTNLSREVARREEIERLASEAVAKAKGEANKAESKLAHWRQKYDARPAGCDAALVEMERQCAAVPSN